ncbi:uncharacterized protein DS421_3g88240 [Arachis hypogaea]|nr:uncharacterized protein LOC112790920 [Arachis hypogaea]QHO58145.1 uncharacterized protein DS421_3g88240 [Arachis hypogaea]QHO58146.1 uncharacterized protein DS421_3g88240 [Arachis hypogaea]QHO58147.1 uncharacterized protein DS421_3g88240 [Arachis hypogaea]
MRSPLSPLPRHRWVLEGGHAFELSPSIHHKPPSQVRFKVRERKPRGRREGERKDRAGIVPHRRTASHYRRHHVWSLSSSPLKTPPVLPTPPRSTPRVPVLLDLSSSCLCAVERASVCSANLSPCCWAIAATTKSLHHCCPHCGVSCRHLWWSQREREISRAEEREGRPEPSHRQGAPHRLCCPKPRRCRRSVGAVAVELFHHPSGHWECDCDHRNHHQSYSYFSSAVLPCLDKRFIPEP